MRWDGMGWDGWLTMWVELTVGPLGQPKAAWRDGDDSKDKIVYPTPM